jgi:uncharacterized repeat protein (TIGR04042 family)
MPAVTVRLRWPDGQESHIYSPSTSIAQHLEPGLDYPLKDFLGRAEAGFQAASERVKQVKGFYCSAAMDSLAAIRTAALQYPDAQARVEVLEIKPQGAGQVRYSGFGDI